MGENKKQRKGKKNDSLDPGQRSEENTQNFHTEVHNHVAEPAKDSLILLEVLHEPNVWSETAPKVEREIISIAVGAIDVIEPAVYDTNYQYLQNTRPLTMSEVIYGHMGMGRKYWEAADTAPCVRIHVTGGQEYLVEGEVEQLTERVNYLLS